MNTLWIFGDSFAADHTEGHAGVLDKQWHRIVGRELGMDVENLAVPGTSLDWVYHTWFQSKSDVKPGDLIIAVLTETIRRWLLKDKPSGSVPFCLANGIYDDFLSSEEIRALRNYFSYLDHDTLVPVYLDGWLYSLAETVQTQGCRALIIPAYNDIELLLDGYRSRFTSIEIARGNLFTNITYQESVPELRDRITHPDGRCNHMVPPNHEVLARKITEWYRGGPVPDLMSDFHTDLINPNNLDCSDLFLRPHLK